jgi:asparagine synthetase B (glutamine-hydrolysing)
VLGALQRPPCVVSFSGGRDSSLVLAVAAHVARREGLALPVPCTYQFPSAKASEEREWQELVITHLRLADWQRASYAGRLDLVGPVAERVLRRHGLVFPALLYVLDETFQAAAGGSYLSGEGGDEVLGARRATLARYVLRSPGWLWHPGQARAVLSSLAPASVRRAHLARAYLLHPVAPWLRPEAASEVATRLAGQRASEPLDWRKSLSWYIGTKRVRMSRASTAALALSHGVAEMCPLLDARFVSAWAAAGGSLGFASRRDAMAYLAGDLLPEPVLSRRAKASFNAAYFTDIARAFVASWDGSGVDQELVDVEALLAEWSEPNPSALSFGLLQEAWLASQPSA